MEYVARIYPSVLNKFQDYLDADLKVEEDWNITPEGDYRMTDDEMHDKLLQELIDTINRVDKEPTEAADAGTCLNEAIDRMLLNSATGREDVTLRTSRTFITSKGEELEIPCIVAQMDDFTFQFDIALCRKLASILKGYIPQYRCSAAIETSRGKVELYGDVDYIGDGHVVDLKSTSMYSVGKYASNWQKELYTYCLLHSGDMTSVKDFTFLIAKWVKRVGTPWSAELFEETYTLRPDRVEADLRSIVERFLEFLDIHRDKITNKKIFGLE